MKKNLKREFGIGAAVIAAIVILIFGIDYLKGESLLHPSNGYIAYFDDVNGLEVTAPVKIQGFKVGQVNNIKFDYDHPGQLGVELSLDKHLRVPVDSRAYITSGLLGSAYVDLELGSSSEFLSKGEAINTTVKSGLLAGVSESLMPKVTGTLELVDSLLINLNEVFGAPELRRSISNIEKISDNVLSATEGLNSLFNRDVRGIMSKADLIMANVNEIVSSLDTITGNFADFTGTLADLPISETVASLNATVKNLEDFSDQLKNQNSTLGLLMNDPELYNRLNSVAASVDSLIVDIKRNPKRYISIKLL